MADARVIGSMPLLPIRTKHRGPAYPPSDSTRPDSVEEAITLFRANALFRNFEFKGPADHLLVYLTLFIADCLSKLGQKQPAMGQRDADKFLQTHASSAFAIPGDPAYPLNAVTTPPASRGDADVLRAYLLQCRMECATRLVEEVLYGKKGDEPLNRWWMGFQKKKFMGKTL